GWGLNDVLALGGVTVAGEVVFGLVPARESASLRPRAPLQLAAMSAAGTAQLEVDGLVVSDEHVVARLAIQEWRAADVRTTAALNPAVLGVAQAATDRLSAVGAERGLAAASDLAPELAGRLADVRTRAYALADDPGSAAEAALEVRAQGQRLCLDATAALVTASGGSAMALADPAQRWAREALFLVVQGQTLPSREALLRTWP
ncbi:MAG: acyl-CoA dehydrogenase, partial [Actinomycetota bacterium]